MSVLNKTDKEYLESLIPKDIPDWKKSWQEGYEIGKTIKIADTPFKKKYGMSDVDYRLHMASQGKMTWQINMGLSNIDEEVAALKEAEKFNEETGLQISYAHQLPKNIAGTPKDKREGLPTALGFDLDEPEDWQRIMQASTVQPIFGDNHIGFPNAVYMTKNCIEAGCSYQGLFGTFQQVAQGCPDEVWNMNENIKALGMVAAKYDDKIIVNSNQDDSMPAYFSDLASYLAWAKWERYVVSDLCKARYAFSFGNLTSNILHKAALWIAASDAFKKDDQPGIEFIYPNTVDHWDHHLHSNYGFQIPEALMVTLVEKKYKTGGSFLSVPITEKVSIPTVPEMLDMTGACQRTAECADYYMELIDWTPIEKLRDKVQAFSDVMFKNIMKGLAEAGVDTTNPIEMMVVFKKMDPTKFESFFHPSVVNEGKANVEPMMPAALWTQSYREAENITKTLKEKGYDKKIKGRRICVVSGDLHYFGSFVVSTVLKALGAEVIDGGNSLDPIDVLDVADEHGITDLCISLHCGQALSYSKLLLNLAKDRQATYRFFLGGALTSFINEDDTEPSDVTPLLREMGLATTATVEELLEALTA